MDKMFMFLADSSGVTMVEYGLMLAFIALVCFASVGSLGNSVLGLYQQGVNGLK